MNAKHAALYMHAYTWRMWPHVFVIMLCWFVVAVPCDPVGACTPRGLVGADCEGVRVPGVRVVVHTCSSVCPAASVAWRRVIRYSRCSRACARCRATVRLCVSSRTSNLKQTRESEGYGAGSHNKRAEGRAQKTRL